MKKSRLFHISALTYTICDANSPAHYCGFASPQAKFWNIKVHNAGGTPCHGLPSVVPGEWGASLPVKAGTVAGAVFTQAGHQCTKRREICVKNLILGGFACSKTAFTVHLLFNFLNSHLFLKVCFLRLDLLQLFFLTYVDDYFSCWPCFSAV